MIVSLDSDMVEDSGPCKLVENTDFALEVEQFVPGTAKHCFEQFPSYMDGYIDVTLMPYVVDHFSMNIVEDRDMVVNQFPII